MYRTQVYCAKGQVIADLMWYPMPTVNGVTGTYREGNARLIAAAPDLLAALKLYQAAGFGNSTDHHAQGLAYDAAVEAIARATGASNA